jgi:hypothetical protein
MPRNLSRLKNPSKARLADYINTVIAFDSGLITRNAAKKKIVELNKKARKRTSTEWYEHPEEPKQLRLKNEIVQAEESIIIPGAIYNKLVEYTFGGKYSNGEDYVWEIYKLLKQLGGINYRLLINYYGINYGIKELENIDTALVFDNEYKAFRKQFLVESDKWIFEQDNRIIILEPSAIEAKYIFQHFRLGISHCVFQPIYNEIHDILSKSSSSTIIRKYTSYLENLKALEHEYEHGVPEDCMERVAKTAHMKITLKDILERTIAVYNENSGKSRTIIFQNTRFDHVEQGNLVRTDIPELVTQEEINKIWTKCHDSNIFYDASMNSKRNTVNKLKTLEKLYEVEDPEKVIFNEFSKSIGLENYKFNAHKYPKIYKFIKAGCIINSQVVKINNGEATNHIDGPKAYTQFKKTDSNYYGFMGIIQDQITGNFDYEFIKKNIGIYKFTVVSCKDLLFRKMGLKSGSIHILPSVEIIYFIENGVICEITEGIVGSRFDFEFSDIMLQKGKDRIPRYSKWSGKLDMKLTESRHSFKCSVEHAQTLKTMYPNLMYWEDKEIATIGLPITGHSSACHILAFITAYTRINVINEMRKIKFDNIIKVICDGIYYKGDKVYSWFESKQLKEHTHFGDGWYVNDYDKTDDEIPTIDCKDYSLGHTLLLGQGGAGKSFSVLTNPSHLNVIYVVPTHLLGKDGYNKYGCTYITIHKLLGKECTPYHNEYPMPGRILIDEITQYPHEWVEEAFQMYPNSIITLAGDVNNKGQWYQCRTGTPGAFAKIWNPLTSKHKVNIVTIEGDRRAKCDILKALKLQIRDKMDEYFIDGDSGENEMIKAWARTNLPMTTYVEAINNFKAGDIWLAATKETNKMLLILGICSGYYKVGGLIVSEETPGYEKKGSFTIHSIQGKTIKDSKIYISVNDLFEYAMLYTAVSRAETMDQIVLVYNFS